jgi:hypothetical protein
MGYLLGHKERHTVIAGPPPVIIIGTTAHLTPYISGLVKDVLPVDPAIDNVVVKAHTRVRYPGGPAIAVALHDRSVDGAKPISNGITLPGRNAYIEEHTGPTDPKILRVVTFTFVGSWYLLRGWVKTHVAAGKKYNLRSPGGKPFLMVGA